MDCGLALNPVRATHLWVILDAPDGEGLVSQSLDGGLAAVLRVRPGGHLELAGDAGGIDDKTVVHDSVKATQSLLGKSRPGKESSSWRDGDDAHDMTMGNFWRVDDLMSGIRCILALTFPPNATPMA